ncbi:MAG: DUF4434 domain-containing protein [Desulfobacterota bacterium]|nr:DUF4434 domain-containing protein [Thermodesulfobacteriota bacterium]
MNRFLLRSTLLLFLVQTILLPGAPAGAEPLTVRDLPGVKGIFLQPGTDNLARDEAYWRTLFQKLRKENMDTLFLQWSAEKGRVFADLELENHEKLPFLEKIFQAARESGLKVFLGLYQETTYWRQIPAPLDVLENFFYLRAAANERLLEQVHKKFGQDAALAGYYIPDEIDDLNWRTEDRIGLYNGYLKLMVERIRKVDPQRPVAVSSFFRSRTAPRIYAENVFAILKDTGINWLLVQDGAGENNPAEPYRSLYLEKVKESKPQGIELAVILEIFTRTSREGEPFAAVAAPRERIGRQIAEVRRYFEHVVAFSLEYLEP